MTYLMTTGKIRNPQSDFLSFQKKMEFVVLVVLRQFIVLGHLGTWVVT